MTAPSYNISQSSQKPVTSLSSIHQTIQSAVHMNPPSSKPFLFWTGSDKATASNA